MLLLWQMILGGVLEAAETEERRVEVAKLQGSNTHWKLVPRYFLRALIEGMNQNSTEDVMDQLEAENHH
eukprot:7637901-Prorocentrum_lima.AAC.1